MNKVPAVWLLMLAPFLGGCVAVAAGGVAAGALAVHDRRTLSALVEDQTIEVNAVRRLEDEAGMGDDTHLRVVSYNGVVLLAGQVPDEAHKRRAEETVQRVGGVRRVVNDLDIGPPIGVGRRLQDGWTTTWAKTSLFGVDIEGFNPSRVKVVTVGGRLYVLGLVTQDEADAVMERVRYVRGVERVVNVFEYLQS